MTAPAKFRMAEGDLLGVQKRSHHVAIEWIGPGRIIFSFAQRGQAMSAHFASDKAGLRHLKTAIDDFCQWVFESLDDIDMVLAIMTLPSVVRLVQRCGFLYVLTDEDREIYARSK